jgi:hypothetical protein
MSSGDDVRVRCPYCFEWVELEIDPDTLGEMIQDCEVCCRPWRVVVTRDGEGMPSVQLDRAQ